MNEYPHAELTGMIIGAAIEVHNALGPGFLESIYEEALSKELKRRGIPFSRQVKVDILYKGEVVGTHVLDLVVADAVVVELKAVKELADIHKAIALSYLAATGLSVALLLNFSQKRLEHKRLARTLS